MVKGFATSLSIVLSSLASWWMPAFDFEPSKLFLAGSSLVILATVLYSSPQPATATAVSPAAAAISTSGGSAPMRASSNSNGGRTVDMHPEADKV